MEEFVGELFSRKNVKWWSIVPGWFLGGVVGAISSFLLVQEITEIIGDEDLDFEVALLRICSLLIKSDGNVDPREKLVTQEYFKKVFGIKKANRIINESKISRLRTYSIRELSVVMNNCNSNYDYYSVIQFLYQLSAIDGSIDSREESVIQEFAHLVEFDQSVLNTIRSFYTQQDRATRPKTRSQLIISHLAVLGLDQNGSVDEVKKAYRKLVKEFHPDMIYHLGPELKKMANENFLKIQESYDYLIEHL